MALDSRRVQAYTSGVALLGGAIVLWALFHLPNDWIGLLGLSTLAILAEWNNIELFQSSRGRLSLSSIIALGSLLLFGPAGGILTHAASGLTTALTGSLQKSQLDPVGRASTLQRSVFNTGMLVCSAAGAGLVYSAFGGTAGQGISVATILPLVLAVLADHIINIGLLVGVVSLQTEKPPLGIWRDDLIWTAPIAIPGGLFGCLLLALGYQYFHLPGLLLFLLPGALIHYSYWLSITLKKRMRAASRKANQDLNMVMDVLFDSQQVMAALVSETGNGELSVGEMHQLAQAIRQVKDNLAVEDHRLQELHAELSQNLG